MVLLLLLLTSYINIFSKTNKQSKGNFGMKVRFNKDTLLMCINRSLGCVSADKTYGAIEGILLTQFNGRTILNRALTGQIERISKQTGLKVFKTTIRNGIAIREAQNNQTNIFDYDSRSKVAKDYQDFINEYLKATKK